MVFGLKITPSRNNRQGRPSLARTPRSLARYTRWAWRYSRDTRAGDTRAIHAQTLRRALDRSRDRDWGGVVARRRPRAESGDAGDNQSVLSPLST
jgi:hypothetical protein